MASWFPSSTGWSSAPAAWTAGRRKSSPDACRRRWTASPTRRGRPPPFRGSPEMPIGLDFPEITDAFRRFLLLPVRQIAHSFEAIALWLPRRVRTADTLEQLSRSFPVVNFTNDAVTLRLDGRQSHGL